ncbi:hypothetical protein ACFJYA_07985 [Enterococcus faecalis]
MELLNPQAELTHALLDVLPQLGVDTYFYLPQEEVDYPFIVVGEQSTNGLYTKERPIVTVQQVIHLFALAEDLEQVQQLAKRVEATIHNLQQTENFQWMSKLTETALLMDDTTNDQLWHQVLTFMCQSN